MWQKKGAEVPCLASKLIEKLPGEGSLTWEEERKIAQNVSAVSYVGTFDDRDGEAYTNWRDWLC